MIERYITGLAFVFGAFGLLATLSALMVVDEEEPNTSRGFFIICGLFSWAWLIARYFL